jgi:hypothetical protein
MATAAQQNGRLLAIILSSLICGAADPNRKEGRDWVA